MSVFKKLKGTFQNAHQDIVVGLRALSFSDDRPTQEELDRLTQREINLDAGASLLHRFQSNWALIQSETSKSTQHAEEVAKCLSPLFKIWDNHSEVASNFQKETKSISSISATLAQLHTLLDNLRQDFLAAEKGLDVLENICEDLEFRNRCLIEHKKLAQYKAKNEAEAEKFKVSLAYQHAKNAAKIETQKKVNLHERAEAFMSAFHDDIKYYRKHGYPDRFPSDNVPVPDLGSVELDQDKETLDSFLGPNVELDNAGNLELSGEEAYIEDDYIADYSVKQDVDFLGGADYTSTAVISEMDLADDGYIYMDNQHDFGFVHEDDDPENANIPDVSKELNDSGEVGGLGDTIIVCESSSLEFSGNSQSHALDLTTEVRATTSVQDDDVTGDEDVPVVPGDKDVPVVTNDEDVPMVISDEDVPVVTYDEDVPMVISDEDVPVVPGDKDVPVVTNDDVPMVISDKIAGSQSSV